MKIDELTKQVTLLGKHHIGTDEQLFFIQALGGETDQDPDCRQNASPK